MELEKGTKITVKAIIDGRKGSGYRILMMDGNVKYWIADYEIVEVLATPSSLQARIASFEDITVKNLIAYHKSIIESCKTYNRGTELALEEMTVLALQKLISSGSCDIEN